MKKLEIKTEEARVILKEAFPDKHYTLGSFCGGGGFGSVWNVYDAAGKQPIVVKMVAVRLPDGWNMETTGARDFLATREKFAKREMEGLKLFSSERNFPTLYDARVWVGQGQEEKVYLFVEEKLHELNEWTSISPLEKAIRVGAAGCAALNKMEKKGWIYRDYKPSNIMLRRTVSGSMEPVLIDFGAAKAYESECGNTIVGSVGHIPPELRKNKRAVPGKTDVYTVGITMLEIYAEEDLFIEKEAELKAEIQQRLKRLSKENPAVGSLVTRMLYANPRMRPTLAKCESELLKQLPPDPVYDRTVISSAARCALAAYQRGDLAAARITKEKLPDTAVQKHLLNALLTPKADERFQSFRIAARLGSPCAAWYLGELLIVGKGTVQDQELGISFIELAEFAGFPPAVRFLENLRCGRKPGLLNAKEYLLEEIAKDTVQAAVNRD